MIEWQSVLGVVGTVVALAILGEALVEAAVVPLFDHYEWDRFWLMYISWLVVGLIVAAGQVNALGWLIPSPIVGQILTIILGGRGSNFFHELMARIGQPQQSSITMTTEEGGTMSVGIAASPPEPPKIAPGALPPPLSPREVYPEGLGGRG